MRFVSLCAITFSAVSLFNSCRRPHEDPRSKTIEEFMEGQREYYHFNGNVLVAEKGEVLFRKSYGARNYVSGDLLNDTSVFELASISKQFTACGILILSRQGKLNLDDSLRSYFPELPYSGITLRQMLTHSSGLPDYLELMESKWDHNKIAFNKDVIRLLAIEKPLVRFKAGSRWEYCNTGYVLLASIIEKVSGDSFKNFTQKNIFEPLGMRDSRVYNTRRSGEVINNYAYGFTWSRELGKYVLPDSLKDRNMVYYLDGVQGDGIINSTTGDLLKWDRAIAAGKLLGTSLTQELLFKHVLCDTLLNEYYGYGVFVGKNELGDYVYHPGGWPGYITNTTRYIDGDRTVIILSNNESASLAIQRAIANILFSKQVHKPYKHISIQQDTQRLIPFVGKYIAKDWEFETEDSSFEIVLENDRLFQIFSSGFRRNLQAESPSKIFTTDGSDLQFELEKGENGEERVYRIMYGVRELIEKLNDNNRTMNDMISITESEIERCEIAAWRDLIDAAPESFRIANGLRHERIGDGLAINFQNVPIPLFNRVIGIGVDQPVTQSLLHKVRQFYSKNEQFIIHCSTSTTQKTLPEALTSNGFVQSGSWERVIRNNKPLTVSTKPGDIQVRLVDESMKEDWVMFLMKTYGFDFYEWPRAFCLRKGWSHYVAIVNNRIVACRSF